MDLCTKIKKYAQKYQNMHNPHISTKSNKGIQMATRASQSA
jgi:hypothetical protein